MASYYTSEEFRRSSSTPVQTASIEDSTGASYSGSEFHPIDSDSDNHEEIEISE